MSRLPLFTSSSLISWHITGTKSVELINELKLCGDVNDLLYSKYFTHICTFTPHICMFVSKENCIFIMLKCCIVSQADFIPLAKVTSTLNV